jgi:hypothetical protein
MRRRASRRSPPAFFLLTFTLAIPFWFIGARGDRLSAGFLSVLPPFLPVSALQAVCPLLAGLVLVYRQDRRDGTLAFLRRVVDPTTVSRKRWYVPVIVLPPLAMGLSYGLMSLMGTLLPEPRIALLSVPVLLALYLLAAVFEEGGWTGYATDPLQARWGALTTSLLLGLVTAVFHVVPLLEVGRTLPWIIGWFAGTVAQRVLMVWLYTTTGRSVFAISVFHALVNVSESLLPNNGAPDPALSGTVLSIMAALVAAVCGPKLGGDTERIFRFERETVL